MNKPLCGPEAMDAKYREIADTYIDAICETKALADTLDTLQSLRGGSPQYDHIIELYQRTMLTRTELSEMLTDSLIDQRNRVSL